MAWSRQQCLVLVPVVLLIHNAEEALSLSAYLSQLQALLPDWLETLLGGPPGLKQGWLTLVLVALLGLLMSLPVGLGQDDRTARLLSLALVAVLLVNVFVHLLTAQRLGGYGPGLVTAVLLVLPFSVWLLRRAWLENWLARGDFLLLPLAALILHGPVLLGLFAISRVLSGLR